LSLHCARFCKYEPYLGWEEFRRDTPDLPETNWDLAWELVFDQIAEQRPRASARFSQYLSSPVLARVLIPRPPTDWGAIRARRRDELVASKERAAQQVEDLEGEVHRLRQARDALVRPQGLGWGLAILGYFTVVGVVLPVLLMSSGKDLAQSDTGSSQGFAPVL
jgi:hypothetical protein